MLKRICSGTRSVCPSMVRFEADHVHHLGALASLGFGSLVRKNIIVELTDTKKDSKGPK